MRKPTYKKEQLVYKRKPKCETWKKMNVPNPNYLELTTFILAYLFAEFPRDFQGIKSNGIDDAVEVQNESPQDVPLRCADCFQLKASLLSCYEPLRPPRHLTSSLAQDVLYTHVPLLSLNLSCKWGV